MYAVIYFFFTRASKYSCAYACKQYTKGAANKGDWFIHFSQPLLLFIFFKLQTKNDVLHFHLRFSLYDAVGFFQKEFLQR